MTLTLIYGMTVSDRAHDYVPSCDGYRPGAVQDTVTVEVEPIDGMDVTRWAEALFVATNAPDVQAMAGYAGAVEVRQALRHTSGIRALSIGDTVTLGEARVACARTGWVQV